jgi:hypothetical protein
MLGVTTFMTTDVAAIPLFWTLPLALYMLSFVWGFARVPLSYYHPDGPLGAIIRSVNDHRMRPSIAVIGLGSGSIAAYGTPQNSLTFYELNPDVAALAQDARYFTYVDDCKRRWCNLSIVVGDGRLQMAKSRETYDLIVIDAFTSDAIPVHLLTVESLDIFRQHLSPGGLLAYHISNRFVALEPVLANLARERGYGYAVRTDDGDEASGRGASSWAVLAAEAEMYDPLVADERWHGLEERDGVGVWRDDYANVLKTFIWQ